MSHFSFRNTNLKNDTELSPRGKLGETRKKESLLEKEKSK